MISMISEDKITPNQKRRALLKKWANINFILSHYKYMAQAQFWNINEFYTNSGQQWGSLEKQ